METKEIKGVLNAMTESIDSQNIQLFEKIIDSSEIKSSISQIGLVNLKIKHLLGL